MSKLNLLLFLNFVVFIIAGNHLFSQSISEKRKQEFEAVRNYLNTMLSQQKDNTNVTSNLTSDDKYSFLKPNSSAIDFVKGEKSFIMNGNNITVDLHNYGGIAAGLPNTSIREISNLVWKNLPYIFQFCPIVGASVPNANDTSKRNHVITDGLYDYDGLRDESPTGERWVWKPIDGYSDPTQPYIASNPAFDSDRDGKPDSWPREWYNATLGEYVWPGYLTQGVNNADLECFWGMDDRDNKEFPYYPYKNDTTKKGLGLKIDARAFQWSNSLAANTLFVVYTITNKSDKDLDSVIFGIYGDPDIGGRDNKDDHGLFIPPYGNVGNVPVYARSMVYFWDPDGKGDRGLPVGYLGCKFLESPGNPNDGIDNDGDGKIDERQDDGIDNDGDWNSETDDVGVDGIPNTNDTGERDGLPTKGLKLPDGTPDPLYPGEPNFEYTDLDEADQIGLTSFNSWTWNQDKISNDESMWYRNVPSNFGDIQQNTDIVFIFGSGYISLKKGETKRISMAFLFGQDLNDLLTSAVTVQDIYNKNYRFFKPPELPTLVAVPDNKKVTLYWDSKAEESIDPITGKDFEGYVIYRSTDPNFSDALKITDGKGANFLYQPLKDYKGFDAKWDIVNEWKGYHPVSYQGRGLQYYLGDNSGLVHSFVDSNNVLNGQTYYYSVVAYDHGDSLGIPPSESTKKISLDPITSALRFDINTAQAIPGPRASGFISPSFTNQNIQHLSGYGNGTVDFKIVNELLVKDNNYKLTFNDSLYLTDTTIKAKNFSVSSDEVINEDFYLYDFKFTKLKKSNIILDGNLVVKDESGKTYVKDLDYVVVSSKGNIRRKENGSMPNNSKFNITYKYSPIYQSTVINGEDANPVFDGIKVTVKNHSVYQPDSSVSGWTVGNKNIPWTAAVTNLGIYRIAWAADYRITFYTNKIDSTYILVPGGLLLPIPCNFKVEDITSGVPKKILSYLNEKVLKDSSLSRGDEIILFKPGTVVQGGGKDTLTWAISFPKTSADTSLPQGGDVFTLAIQRPFDKTDVFTLKTQAGKVDNKIASERLDKIYVVPNPYIAVNEIEPANRLQSQNRGERRIYFENLPMKCTIRIYTLSGELVQQIEHEQGVDNGREFWNLLNKDGFSVAYGIYLAHIDAPNIGEKLIKFALIK